MHNRIRLPNGFNDDVCDLSEVDAGEASVRADSFEACSSRSSSIAKDLFAGSW